MTRPAVIIGLGGTGQWVTTYVKKELLEDNGGKMPTNVRLLCFDTWPDANVGGTEAAIPEVVTIGTTKLDLNTEFMPLSGDTYSRGEEVVAGIAPHFGKRISDMGDAYTWFDAPYFRNNVPRATWNLNIGAGQIRQFGRMGFFNHATEIKQSLSIAFTQVKETNPLMEKIQVMIIASFAGGTGAGMLIDMANLARSLSGELGPGGGLFRGIFVLPGAFISSQSQGAQAMKARAYAAWRELARFMNLGPDYGAHDVKYDNQTSIRIETKPFDQVFLVDADRDKHAFTNTKPENGIFPSIATYISTALDDDAGVDLGNAINTIQTDFDKKLGFSTFGAYSVQFPISHAINEYALQLDRDLLKRWLAPHIEIKNGKESVAGLESDKNLEKPGERGSQELKTFMSLKRHKLDAVINRSVVNIPNPTRTLESLPILAAIYKLYEAATTGTYRGKVEQDAQGGYCRPGEDKKINSESWLGRLLLPGDHDKTTYMGPDGLKMVIDSTRLEGEVNSNVRGAVPTSRDNDTDPTQDEADRIIRDVENINNGYIVKHYGVTGGRGSFDEELDKLVNFNDERFKQILEIELLNLLNGTVSNSFRGFSGRLGYVEEFCKSLFEALEWFKARHLQEVKVARGMSGLEGEAKQTMDALRVEMVENAGKKCMVFFNHPRAHIKQAEYLEEVQNYCEVLKDERLFFALDRLAGVMKNNVAQVQAQIEKWKRVLVQAPDSLYSQVLDEYTRTKHDLDDQAKANQSQKLQILRDYPTDYTQDSAVIQRIDEQLNRIRWGVKTDGGFTIGCEVYKDGEFTSLLNEGDKHGHNKAIITDIGRWAWKDFGGDHTLVDEIGRPGPKYLDPTTLANELIAHSEPMFISSTPGAGIKSAMRRASRKSNDPNFNAANYLDQIDSMSPTITPKLDPKIGYMRSDSANLHKLSLIQWVDRLNEKDFKIYTSLNTSYRELIRGGESHETASRLHIFPAEGNAAFYEHRLPIWLNQQVRELSPRVVLLMTDVQKVRFFFQCYALGFILHGRYMDKPGRWWRLVTPATSKHPPQDVLFYDSADASNPDPFDLINKFVEGKDALNNMLIVWDAVELSVHQSVQSLKKTGLKDQIDAQFTPNSGVLPIVSYINKSVNVDDPYRLIHQLETSGKTYYQEYIQSHGKIPEYNPGWSWVRSADYKDLADVGRMMYIEILLLEKLITNDNLTNSIYLGN